MQPTEEEVIPDDLRMAVGFLIGLTIGGPFLAMLLVALGRNADEDRRAGEPPEPRGPVEDRDWDWSRN